MALKVSLRFRKGMRFREPHYFRMFVQSARILRARLNFTRLAAGSSFAFALIRTRRIKVTSLQAGQAIFPT